MLACTTSGPFPMLQLLVSGGQLRGEPSSIAANLAVNHLWTHKFQSHFSPNFLHNTSTATSLLLQDPHDNHLGVQNYFASINLRSLLHIDQQHSKRFMVTSHVKTFDCA